MRRILTGFAMAAVMAAIPSLALAGNQEIAEQIAQNLRQSGQMSDYKIGVKYQDGTVWMRGRVNDEEQMATALKTAYRTPGVKRIVNELSVASDGVAPAAKARGSATMATQKRAKTASRSGAATGRDDYQDTSVRAERVPSSYASRAIERTSMQESPEVLPQRVAAPTRMMAPDGPPMPMYSASANPGTIAPARYDQPCMPNYAWPSYASYPNYAAVTYPKQYSPTAWPYIGPFYPYPQVPLGWRKVTLEWDDGWWFLDFKDQPASAWHR